MKSPLTPLLPVLLLSVLVLLTASSCTSLRVSPISVTLSAADSLMMTDPQSALDTLLTADSLTVLGLCGRDAAYYGLLMAEARYKCYLPVSEDTSVFFSSEYYRRHGPDSLYARALMMCGAVHAENGDPSSALEKYKAAEPVMEAVGDYEQLGLLHTRMGELYQKTFTDGPSMVYHYRSAVRYFEKGGASGRLPAAYLSLSRVMLPYKDSLPVWERYYRKGLGYAAACKDTLRLVEAADQKATYLRLYKGDYEEAVMISQEALSKYREHLTLNYCTDFNFIISESYLRMGNSDSAKVYADRIPDADAVSRMLRDRLNARLSGSAGEWESAYGYNLNYLALQDSLRDFGEELMLSDAEQSIDGRRALRAHMNEKRNLKAAIAVATAVTVLACFLAVSVSDRLRVLRSKIRRAVDDFDIQADGTENETDDINRLLSYVKEHINSLRKRDDASSAVSAVVKAQLSLLDEILEEYYVYSSADNRLGARISDIIERHLQRNKARESVMRTAAVLYPGFLEYLQDRYGFTETDLFYTSMLLCGFNNSSQQVLTGNKMTSISVARSKAAAKTGKKTKLSAFILEELELFQGGRPCD